MALNILWKGEKIKMDKDYDFSGWATKNNLKCSDGRTILKDAFKHDDGVTVPLVWNHQHNDPINILGHALLENRDEGVYAYCKFNETDSGKNAKLLVEHGDVSALSIYANQLKQQGGNVIHGAIREVSLVLAGANPGAFIDSVIAHGEESEEEAVIFTGEDIVLSHANETNIENKEKEEKKINMSENENKKTVKEVFDTLTEEQKTAVYAIIGQALEEAGVEINTDEEGDKEMKHNVFDNDQENKENFLSHSDTEAIFSDAKRYGSLKDSTLAHGITNLEYLFPEDTNLNKVPEFISRDTGWVKNVMGSVHHTPFSRIKSQFADITADDARAKGYTKGNLKKEEVFSLLKRTTTPTTVYKKQKLDRDDVIDITDFDVVSWIKGEMRMMLDEELARAFLIGDGRLSSSDDKINEQNIRPIYNDADLYTVKAEIDVGASATSEDKAKAFIKSVIKNRKEYKGTGSPTLYTTEDVVADCLLLEDSNGRFIYDTMDKLKNVLRVKDIVTVPAMEGAKGAKGGNLMAILVNLADYNVGADKGGAVNMFDDFDIDYNAQKYLIETRCSGALIKPYSAIAFEIKAAA
ncbi:MAG: phage major capsid protein [Weeksellaceae bacterium]|nr:phage major capsid protein [Weeksellaceae bacterium]